MRLFEIISSIMQKNKKSKSRVPRGLAPQYQKDFDRKDSGHTPEVVRRVVLSIYNSSVASTGAACYSASNASGVVNSPEFTAIANQGIYRLFRVVAMRVRVCAVYQTPVSPIQPSLGNLVGAVCGGNNVPPNDNRGMLSSQGFRIGKGPVPMLELQADAGLNPNALLWSTVNTAGSSVLPSSNDLSIAWRFTLASDVSYNGKTITNEWYEYDIEFRTGG
jgi:hypothetical protein